MLTTLFGLECEGEEPLAGGHCDGGCIRPLGLEVCLNRPVYIIKTPYGGDLVMPSYRTSELSPCDSEHVETLFRLRFENVERLAQIWSCSENARDCSDEVDYLGSRRDEADQKVHHC